MPNFTSDLQKTISTFIESFNGIDEEPLKSCAATIKDLASFQKFKEAILEVLDNDYIFQKLRALEELCASRRKSLFVLIDLGGTLFYRAKEDKEMLKKVHFDFRVKQTKIYLRPGFKDFIKSLFDHPDITIAFYTSILLKNA